MGDPERDADNRTADHNTFGEGWTAPFNEQRGSAVRRDQDSDQQKDGNQLNDAQDHPRKDGTPPAENEALALIGGRLAKSIRHLREARDPNAYQECAMLLERMYAEPVRTPADLLALLSLSRAIVVAPASEMPAESAIEHALPFLDRAIDALELDTGISAEAFTGADHPNLN